MNKIARIAVVLVLLLTVIATEVLAEGNESTMAYGSYLAAEKGGNGVSMTYIHVVFTNTTESPAEIRIFNNVNDFAPSFHNNWKDENGNPIKNNDYITVPAGRSYTLRMLPKSACRRGYAFNYITTVRSREGYSMIHESRFVDNGNPIKGNYYADGSMYYNLAKSPCYYGGSEKDSFSGFLAQKVITWMGLSEGHPIFKKTINKLTEALTKAFHCDSSEKVLFYSVVMTEIK